MVGEKIMKTILDEAKKKKQTFDMLASMHFKMRDYYNKWNTIFDSAEILFSVLICGFTFINIDDYFNFDIKNISFLLGFTSILLFAFTLIKQKLDFKSKAQTHILAGKMYSKAKVDLAQKIIMWEKNCTDDKQILDYLNETFKNLNNLEQVPENKFHKLKHYHKHKVEFSKFLDDNSRIPYLLCKIKFCFEKIKRKK